MISAHDPESMQSVSKKFCITLHISAPKTAILPKEWRKYIENRLLNTDIDKITDIQWEDSHQIDAYRYGKFRIFTDQYTALAEIMQWRLIDMESFALSITQKDILEDNRTWHTDHIRPAHFSFSLIASNTANVQIFNTSKYRGMIYNAIEDIDPKFAKRLHANTFHSQWNFGTMVAEKFSRPESGYKGDYTIEKGCKLSWHISTIYPEIADRIAKISELHLGELKLSVEKCKCDDKTYQIPPERFSAITVQINTPLILFDASKKQYLPLTEENLVAIQIAKLRKAGILSADMPDIHEYIRFLQIPSTNKGLSVVLDNGQSKRFEGLVGFLTIKVMGDEIIKEHLYNLFQISQFVGLGTNCNIGFGQNFIKNIN